MGGGGSEQSDKVPPLETALRGIELEFLTEGAPYNQRSKLPSNPPPPTAQLHAGCIKFFSLFVLLHSDS